MKAVFWMMSGAVLTLAGCEEYQGGTTDASSGFITNLPESVAALAAPYQDLSAVKVNPTDGCYVYRHVGPVETTLLPLRTPEGRPICTKAAEPAAAPAAT
jgi:hypothetical protein